MPLLRTLAPGGTDTYRVSAAPGAAVVIQASSVSPALGPVSLQLSGPGVSISTCTGLVSFVGASDDFTLKVSQCGGASGGEYTLAFSVVSDDASNCGTPLPCGATPAGTGFSVPGEVDSFTVSLQQDQPASFKANYSMPQEPGMLYPYLRLFDPNGTEVEPGVVSGRCAGSMDLTPPSSGNYTVLVSTCGPPETLAYRLEFYQSGCPIGPTITHFGIVEPIPDVDGLLTPIGFDTGNRPIFNRSAGEGFVLVVEARAGHDGQLPGGSTVPYQSGPTESDPDLQVILSQPLGNGDPTICDVAPPNLGGVRATVPFDFTSDPDLLANVDDMGCRFNNGPHENPYMGVRDSSEACTFTGQGFGYSFVDRGSGIQYCAEVASAWSFPEGDTIVAARVKDAKTGNFGAPREIVVRIGDPSPATATPTATRTPPATRMPSSTPTRTRTRTPTRTGAPGTPTATPTGPTPTMTETPIATPCPGDCTGAGVVTINDLVSMVNIAIGGAPLTDCPAGDVDGTGEITIDDLVQAVNASLTGCPVAAGT